MMRFYRGVFVVMMGAFVFACSSQGPEDDASSDSAALAERTTLAVAGGTRCTPSPADDGYPS